MNTANQTHSAVQLKAIFAEQQRHIELLQQLIRVLRHKQFGAKAKVVSPDQLSLFQKADLPEASYPPLERVVEIPAHRRQRQTRDRFETLPTVVEEMICRNPKKFCTCCGGGLHRIGKDSKTMVEFVPATLSAKQIIRWKYACKQCEGNVKRAALPVRLLPKSFASSSLLAYLIVAKYTDHAPLHRLEQSLQRHGIYLSRSTQSDWMVQIGAKLQPLVDLLRKATLQGPRIWTDDTILPL